MHVINFQGGSVTRLGSFVWEINAAGVLSSICEWQSNQYCFFIGYCANVEASWLAPSLHLSIFRLRVQYFCKGLLKIVGYD